MARLGTWVFHEFLPRIPHNEWREPGKLILSSLLISRNIQVLLQMLPFGLILEIQGIIHLPWNE